MTRPAVHIWALPSGGDPVYLADLGDYELSRVRGEIGTVKFQYPSSGAGFELLERLVQPNTELEVEIRTDGTDDSARTAIMLTAKGDPSIPGSMWEITGLYLGFLMKAARTSYSATDQEGETNLSGTPGRVFGVLMARAQDRGLLPGITWDFTDTLDSNGDAWAEHMEVEWSPGRDYVDCLQTMENDLKVAEWDVTDDRVLKLYNPGSRGTDRTLPPASGQVVLEWGRDIKDAPTTGSNLDSGTRIVGVGKDGLYSSATNPIAEAARGRPIEIYKTWGEVTDQGVLDALVQAEASFVGQSVASYSHELTLADGCPLPGRDFDVSDTVLRRVLGETEALQVSQWLLKRESGVVSATVGLGDLIDDHEVKTRKLIQSIGSGSSIVGESTLPAETDDGLAPAAPTGLFGSSMTYKVQYNGDTLVVVQVNWTEVTTNSDGSTATDVIEYEVQYRESSDTADYPWILAGNPAVSNLEFGNVVPGTPIEVRVLARDKFGRISEWSELWEHVTAVDEEPPPKPQALDASVDLGRIVLEFSELAADGVTPMPLDYSAWRVHVSEAASFTADESNLYIEHVKGTKRTQWSPAGPEDYGVSFFFVVVAVDRDGNASEPSDAVEAVPTAIGFADLPYKDNGNLAEDGSFEDPSGRLTTFARSDGAWAPVEATTGDLADHGTWFARGTGATGAGTERALVMSSRIPARPSQQFVQRLAVRRDAAANGSIRVQMVFYMADGSSTSSALDFAAASMTAGAWTEQTVTPYTAPAGTVEVESRVLLRESVTAGLWDVDRVELRELIGTVLIQDAAITNAKIANLDVGKLTSGELTAVIAMLGEIRTANAPNARVTINDSGIRKYDGANVLRLEITESTTYIDGSLVTGRAGESRIEMGNGAFGRDSLVTYDEANRAIVVLGQVYNQITGQPSNNGILIQEVNDRDVFWVYGTGVLQAQMGFRGRKCILYTVTGQDVPRGGYVELRYHDDGDSYFGRYLLNGTSAHHGINSSGTHYFDIGNGRYAEINTNGLIATRFRGYGGTAILESGAAGDVQFGAEGGKLAVYSGAGNFFIKNFVIDHPDDPGRWLVHGCTEAPHAGVEYWGTAAVHRGRAVVELPGYFESLTHEEGRSVLLTPMDAPAPRWWRRAPSASASYPVDGRFEITTRGLPDGARVSWLVKAIRADVPPLEAEPLRSEWERVGDGPYTYLVPRQR